MTDYPPRRANDRGSWHEELLPKSWSDSIAENPVYNALANYVSRPTPDLAAANRELLGGSPIERIARGQTTLDEEYPPEPNGLAKWLNQSDPHRNLGTGLEILANFIGPGAKPRLPMDHASRMARARGMGFNPAAVYHGTASKDGSIFPEFDPRYSGRVSGSHAAREGVSVATRPDVANEFASLAAQRSGGDPAVMPLMYRSDRRAALTLDGSETNLEVAATLNQAFRDGGYDAVVLRNYTTPNGSNGHDVVVVRDPSQLRSVNAAFDPSRKSSANLLASRLGLLSGTAAGAAGYAWPEGTQ